MAQLTGHFPEGQQWQQPLAQQQQQQEQQERQAQQWQQQPPQPQQLQTQQSEWESDSFFNRRHWILQHMYQNYCRVVSSG
ncbi:MAG: hypothetical protein ACKPKO_17940, partial [Candidatus Fonsibacter sp.]